MSQHRFINENGLTALKLLSQEKPSLFIDAEPDELVTAMEAKAGTSDLWDAPLDLKADLSLLNEIEKGGPGMDARHARIVRNALGHLPPSEGLDEHRWASVNCFVLPRYASIRWSQVQPKEPERLPRFVARHWLNGEQVGARQDNSIARPLVVG